MGERDWTAVDPTAPPAPWMITVWPACRLLGSLAEAEDAVQETSARWYPTPGGMPSAGLRGVTSRAGGQPSPKQGSASRRPEPPADGRGR
jgi:hypothetical protein